MPFRTIPKWLSWLQYVSWYNYAFEALLVNQWEGYGNISKRWIYNCLWGQFFCSKYCVYWLCSLLFEIIPVSDLLYPHLKPLVLVELVRPTSVLWLWNKLEKWAFHNAAYSFQTRTKPGPRSVVLLGERGKPGNQKKNLTEQSENQQTQPS